jgi:hypothetical protein
VNLGYPEWQEQPSFCHPFSCPKPPFAICLALQMALWITGSCESLNPSLRDKEHQISQNRSTRFKWGVTQRWSSGSARPEALALLLGEEAPGQCRAWLPGHQHRVLAAWVSAGLMFTLQIWQEAKQASKTRILAQMGKVWNMKTIHWFACVSSLPWDRPILYFTHKCENRYPKSKFTALIFQNCFPYPVTCKTQNVSGVAQRVHGRAETRNNSW